MATGRDLHERLEGPESADGPLRERLARLVRDGMVRLDRERDLNRLVVRDLQRFPELMDKVREREMQRIAVGFGEWLSRESGGDRDRDWCAIATVLSGAVANYWVLRDVFGSHPSGVGEPAFVEAAVDLVVALIEEGGGDS